MYLILHKVRGEPAFDIATQIEIGNELGWIIPTSGHRAYPHAVWPLNQLWFNRDYVPTSEVDVPTDLPDHYDVGAAPQANFNLTAMMSKLLPKIHRRL